MERVPRFTTAPPDSPCTVKRVVTALPPPEPPLPPLPDPLPLPPEPPELLPPLPDVPVPPPLVPPVVPLLPEADPFVAVTLLPVVPWLPFEVVAPLQEIRLTASTRANAKLARLSTVGLRHARIVAP